MTVSGQDSKIIGKKNGRKIAPQDTEAIHRSQWYPEKHPGTCQVPYILYPLSITEEANSAVREIWASSEHSGKDFLPFEITEIPNKFQLAQILACGLKASNATYSQHWQGMYFDWEFNEAVQNALSGFKKMPLGEKFVINSFATVILINTGYGGAFMDMLRLRRRLIPPSLLSLEQIDMGTFEHNINCAVSAVLGGHIGVNVIRHSLSKELIDDANRDGYEALKKQVMFPGMNENGRISSIIQIGFKQHEHRKDFAPEFMELAAAKLIERKSERRNVDFSLNIPAEVMQNFFSSFNAELKKSGLQDTVKAIIIEGNTPEGQETLSDIRDRIFKGISNASEEIIKSYEDNKKDGIVNQDRDSYTGMAKLVVDLGHKVLKPREDSHKMVIVYIDLHALNKTGIPIDMAEQVAGEAIQAGLNSIHLDGTTNIPGEDDLKYGAFCLTGPIHAAELLDSDEQLNWGWGYGFFDIIAPELPPINKMIAIIAISAKHEQDAIIAEKQAMDERKSVNEVFWYRTWNHPDGKKLDIPHWISYSDIIQTVPIPGNDIALKERPLPEQMPFDHPLTDKFLKKHG